MFYAWIRLVEGVAELSTIGEIQLIYHTRRTCTYLRGLLFSFIAAGKKAVV